MISQTTSPAGGLLLILLSRCHFPESPSTSVLNERFSVHIPYRFTVRNCRKIITTRRKNVGVGGKGIKGNALR